MHSSWPIVLIRYSWDVYFTLCYVLCISVCNMCFLISFFSQCRSHGISVNIPAVNSVKLMTLVFMNLIIKDCYIMSFIYNLANFLFLLQINLVYAMFGSSKLCSKNPCHCTHIFSHDQGTFYFFYRDCLMIQYLATGILCINVSLMK